VLWHTSFSASGVLKHTLRGCAKLGAMNDTMIGVEKVLASTDSPVSNGGAFQSPWQADS